MDLLWPEEAGEKVANRLSVALSTLRGVLGPAKPGSSNYFLVSDRETCRLDLEHVEVDVERFLKDVAKGLALARTGDRGADELLRRAESAYTGDFLEENAYDDWAVGLRDELGVPICAPAEPWRKRRDREATPPMLLGTYGACSSATCTTKLRT